jgi:hypothetical protein
MERYVEEAEINMHGTTEHTKIDYKDFITPNTNTVHIKCIRYIHIWTRNN